MSIINSRNWIYADTAASGDTTVISGQSGTRLMLKKIILTTDAENTIFFKSSTGKRISLKMPFPHVGGMYAVDDWDVILGDNKDLVINSSTAAGVSMQIEVQRIAS